MKKTLTVLICILAAVACAFAAAENNRKEDYTVVSVNGAFNIRGITPEGYRLKDTENLDSMIWASFSSDDPLKPDFDLVISFAEEYADVERLNDLSEGEMTQLMNGDPTLNDKIDIMETDYGTKVMILRSNNPLDDFASFVTIYKGYEIALNLFPGRDSTEPLTDAQIAQAMKFLSDLDFVPVD
jgi:hypothetical protein